MTKRTSDELLRYAAHRARTRASFIASALAAYQANKQWTDTELAAFLECPPEALTRLALCRRPAGDAGAFRGEVQRIAGFAGVAPLRLAQLLREVDAAAAFREGTAAPRPMPGMLLAARDRDTDEAGDEQGPAGDKPTAPRPTAIEPEEPTR